MKIESRNSSVFSGKCNPLIAYIFVMQLSLVLGQFLKHETVQVNELADNQKSTPTNLVILRFSD